MLKRWTNKYKLTIIGGLIGALGGFLYWKFVGCASGTCPITSNPLNSTIYGMIIGGLLGSSIQDKKDAHNKKINASKDDL